MSTNQLPLVQLDQVDYESIKAYDVTELQQLIANYKKAVITNALYPDAFHVSREREKSAHDLLLQHYVRNARV